MTDAQAAQLAAEAAVRAAWIGVGGTVIVALLGFGATVLTAWLGHRREKDRWALEDERAMRGSGQAAARGVLRQCEAGADLMFEWADANSPTGDGPGQSELRPFFEAIRAGAIEIPDVRVREIVEHLGGVLFMQELVRDQFVDWQVGELGHKVRIAAREVLGAYLRSEPIPEQAELVELDDRVDEYMRTLDRNQG